MKVYVQDDMSARVDGTLVHHAAPAEQWPKDPFVLHTIYSLSYRKLEHAAQHNPRAAEYLRDAPGPRWMRRMSAIKVGLVLLFSAVGM